MDVQKRGRRFGGINISALIPYFLLIVILIIMGVYQPGVINFNWLNRQADSWITLALAGIGQTLVFMIGGTDLSVGGLISFTNCLAAVYMPESPLGIAAFSLGIILIGAIAGMFNGLIIVKFRLQPFIATLTTWAIWSGAALCILSVDGGDVPKAFTGALLHKFGSVKVSLILLILLGIAGVFFKVSRLGIALLAVGSNEKGAYFGGISVARTKIAVYMISGTLAACAGLFRTAQVSSGSPTAGDAFILLSCAAAVIGGCSPATGHYSFTGAILGAVIMRLLTNLMVVMGVSSYMTSFLQGVILILSVCISSFTVLFHNRKKMEVDV
ncbi:MAG TPA: ABC transporter permease [Candidatus Egerieimonas intestinavium]|uniref:ABC transporter permease n=1 Tax=Candidatus Egerieimonas intestinavium TaxID=2840777 RepID=A0A9D1EIQ3_9FIRM|nr:ABC transporter permease [Candidatus Egerieimonas intestinavium]